MTLPDDPPQGLDPALDPDRYDPDRVDPEAQQRSVSPDPTRGLDMSQDPDRYDPTADVAARDIKGRDVKGKDLTELLGKERSFEEERSPFIWLLGLIAVFAFLGLVSLIFANLSPR